MELKGTEYEHATGFFWIMLETSGGLFLRWLFNDAVTIETIASRRDLVNTLMDFEFTYILGFSTTAEQLLTSIFILLTVQ
jgi:hypothetical protein